MRERSCGVLLHISSLPAPFGIGDLGPAARSFASGLAAAGVSYWQMLPLTQTEEFLGNSPYSSPSAFAGNPLFISPELLLEEGWISPADLDDSLSRAGVKRGLADYAGAGAQRRAILHAAYERCADLEKQENFAFFCRAEAGWLDDYALFASIKDEHTGESWVDWPEKLKNRDPDALRIWELEHRRSVLRHKFIQYIFFRQWRSLRRHCRLAGLDLIGDLPIYVTHDSSDVWANQNLFQLDEKGCPLKVAGVPPDYFSATGQRWGNPVYDWEAMSRDGFSWWIKRLEHNLHLADLVRLDHFRGFCGYWAIPAEESTAVNGEWVKGPGETFFKAMQAHFGENLPLIAEDLGVITDDVRAVMRSFDLPGMKVLQFAFGGDTPALNPDAPFRHQRNSVAYTGTHDNTTTLDWFRTAPVLERDNLSRYLGRILTPEEALEGMLRLALGSPADLAVIPMQDILGLGSEGRMNTPSVGRGNWEWRLSEADWNLFRPVEDEETLEEEVKKSVPPGFQRLHDLCAVYGRLPL